MQLHRRQWICSGGCQEKFRAKEILRGHLREMHSQDFTKRQLPVLLDMCERPIDEDEIVKCPLCPTSLALPKLQVHLASHLEEIALFVLPPSQLDAGETNSNRAAASRSLSQSMDDIPSLPSLTFDEDPVRGEGETPNLGPDIQEPSATSVLEIRDEQLRARRNIIKDLLDGDRALTDDMSIVQKLYKETIGAVDEISAEDINMLFGNIDQMVQFSSELHEELRKAARSVYDPRPQRSSLQEDSYSPDKEKDFQTQIGNVFIDVSCGTDCTISFTIPLPFPCSILMY